MDKPRIREAVIAKLTRDLDLQTRAAQMSREEATSEESKSEHKYDMRGQEAAYLAEGQARLAADLQDTLNVYQSLAVPTWNLGQSIGIGALVTLEGHGRTTHYFVGPKSGGLDIDLDGTHVTVVTPQSPLGRQLLGKKSGDSVQLPAQAGPQAHQITAVA